MKKESWRYKNGKFVKVTKFHLITYKIKHFFKKWKIINTDYYWIVPNSNRGKHFVLTDKEYKESEKIYNEKGTISFEFYPCGGIGWGVKIHVIETGEIIDITDVESW